MLARRRFLIGGLPVIVLAPASCSHEIDQPPKLEASSPYTMAVVAQIVDGLVYPKSELMPGTTREVQVSFVIDRQGRLLDAQITRSSGSRALDGAVLDAIHKATFQPLPPNLKTDRARFVGPILFKVQP